ncbi:hypothetical protein KUTeg_005927 [Tegillarca granosa]|uniref:Uncharacterized protein n=1 Tax=Tegillarca granosa TaxID=220873 RepID=A0ABQ9FGU0_TEGGR|nr:hypothetical protein KUTeg_005927 [Tegillarca granosa]
MALNNFGDKTLSCGVPFSRLCGPNNFQQIGQTLIFNKTTKSHKGIYNCTATTTLTPSNHSVLNNEQEINVDIDILYYSKNQFKQLKLDNRLFHR